MRINLAILSLFCLVLWHGNAVAEITITNGYWSTSFVGCSANPARTGTTCDGLDLDDAGYPADFCHAGSNPFSVIGSAGNYSGGAGGNGLRMYYAGGQRNDFSASAKVIFPAGVTEFWLRFYQRFAIGQTIGGIFESKQFYAFTNGGNSLVVNYPYWEDRIQFYPQGTSMSEYASASGGWRTIHRGSSSDGSWHYFEYHVKMGNGTTAFDIWVDGVNYIHLTGLAGFGTATRWNYVLFPQNHNVFMLSGCNPHDIDDIAIATPAYTGFVQDSSGRNMIGGLQGGKKPSPVMNIVPPPLY